MVVVCQLQNVFVTGGCSLLPNFEDRLHNEVMAIRPFGSDFTVWAAGKNLLFTWSMVTSFVILVYPSGDKQLDAWKGAALWSGKNKQSFVTNADYQENGTEYFKEHFASNHFVRTRDMT